ncbi:hypothetical protein [Staphylococcus saprophyticus]|uniref:hypothetical protein n=1 Tax=Staphylococcus TaxID=1279 RepID=UPI002DB8B11D|nr:hypothetical protein [Staphylococcus saprophyticus]MEB7677972.1 hypothetical protein [Staphylococcus saprophyticus]
MNYKEIREMLKSSDVYEVVKAIISFELNITDNKALDEITEFYFNNKYMPNILDHEICEMADIGKYNF